MSATLGYWLHFSKVFQTNSSSENELLLGTIGINDQLFVNAFPVQVTMALFRYLILCSSTTDDKLCFNWSHFLQLLRVFDLVYYQRSSKQYLYYLKNTDMLQLVISDNVHNSHCNCLEEYHAYG